MSKQVLPSILKYGFEFLCIFIGVFAAFTLDNWNENRKERNVEKEILAEIRKGLQQDTIDMRLNCQGHENGLKAVLFFKKMLLNKPVAQDSIMQQYFDLFRNFISVQNVSGYETLKSRGLGLVRNDSLRSQIIALYENDYNSVRKLEEDYDETQYQRTYFEWFNNAIAPNMILDTSRQATGFLFPLKIPESERKKLLIGLWKIQANRAFVLSYYSEVKAHAATLMLAIDKELKHR